MSKIRTYLAPLMALVGVVEAVLAAVWPWPQFNIAWALLAVVSLLLAVYLRVGDLVRLTALVAYGERSTPQRKERTS